MACHTEANRDDIPGTSGTPRVHGFQIQQGKSLVALERAVRPYDVKEERPELVGIDVNYVLRESPDS
jgi:hypothetical protein